MPTIRSQNDDNNIGALTQKFLSNKTALDCSNLPSETRQEFKRETEIKYILDRYLGNPPLRPQPVFTPIDYNMDLQQAYAAVRNAKDAWAKMPPELRADYPTWQAMLLGIENGEFKLSLDLAKENSDTQTPATTPATQPEPPS